MAKAKKNPAPVTWNDYTVMLDVFGEDHGHIDEYRAERVTAKSAYDAINLTQKNALTCWDDEGNYTVLVKVERTAESVDVAD